MTSVFDFTSGPRDARIICVGEAWGAEEAAARLPFVGAAGRLLRGGPTSLMGQAGLDTESILFTNIVPRQPMNNEMWRFFEPSKGNKSKPVRLLHPTMEVLDGIDRLNELIQTVRPALVIAAGNYPLWALSDRTKYTSAKDSRGKTIQPTVRVPNGIGNWRSSMIRTLVTKTPLLPIYHPSAILRQWENFYLTRQDLRTRVPLALSGDWDMPKRTYLAPPTYNQAVEFFEGLLLRLAKQPVLLSVDIETLKRSFITCVGFCYDPDFAISVPFVVPQTYDPYYSSIQETNLRRLIRAVLSHPNAQLLGQNFIYDIQYLEREFLVTGLKPYWDTMTAQHLLLPGTPKSLAHLSSLYCRHHYYWKDDSEEWDEKQSIEDLLTYNCEDVVRTLLIAQAQMPVVLKRKPEQWAYMMETTELSLEMMRNGLASAKDRRQSLSTSLRTVTGEIKRWFDLHLPQSRANPLRPDLKPWYTSAYQLRDVLESLGLRIPKDRKTGAMSTGKESMKKLKKNYPGLNAIFSRIEALRSIEDSIEMVEMTPDYDGRIRSTLNPNGAETFRWSSSTNAFGRGGNLQNLPKLSKVFGEDDDDDGHGPDDSEGAPSAEGSVEV